MLLYGLLVLAAIGVDAFLHAVGQARVGLHLGWVGTGLILASFVYSLRKRNRISIGRPSTLLRLHEVLAWLGALAILVHAGVHLHALLPWLAVATMMMAVASGMTGRVLLTRARRSVARAEGAGHPSDEDLGLPAETWTLGALGSWRRVHLPITLNFFVLAGLHILAVLVLG
ncbi:MAG: hypothetical protein JSU66_00840 [Deltaproteobacteria bacterium]|nr:MAG: hypothetical protein JSU66_00840 [Deltaproteobacteria bacterium]